MAVDQFGNPLTEEELYQLMLQQQQMGLLPGLLGGPAVDTFSGIPSSLPAYGPAAGLGPSAYMGAPQGMPTYNQSPELAAPSIMVDAGMATVPFTGMESSFGDGTQVAQAGPSWGLNVSPDSVGVSWGVPKDLPTQDPTGSIIWPSQPTTDLPVSDIVKDIIPLPGIPEGMSQPEIDVETQIDTFSGLGGIPEVDVDVQAGMLDVGPTSVAQLGGADYSQVMADAGMAPVTMATRTSLPGRTTQSQQSSTGGDADVDYNTGDFAFVPELALDLGFGIATGGEDYTTYDEQQNLIETFRSKGLITAAQAQQLKGKHLSSSQWSNMLNILSGPAQAIDQLSDTDWTGFQQFLDAIKTGSSSGLNQLIGGIKGKAGVDIGTQVDAALELVTSGVRTPAEMEASIPEMQSQVDTFKDIPAPTVPAYTGPTLAERKAAAAAQRKSDLAAQKAAAAATRELTRLRNLQTAQDKARQVQDAKDRAKAKRTAAKALKALLETHEKGTPSSAEINAQIEVMTEIDTFGSGGQRTGPSGGYGGEVGGRDTGGGYHGR